MKLTIKYFASIREQLGFAQEVMMIDVPALSVDSLRAQLASRDARAADALRADRPVRTAVNQEMVAGTFVLRDDSEVAFFPPVTGG
ncbi:molybdopterin synthase sulfur carrier subunit [Burkholderia multivorans]